MQMILLLTQGSYYNRPNKRGWRASPYDLYVLIPSKESSWVTLGPLGGLRPLRLERGLAWEWGVEVILGVQSWVGWIDEKSPPCSFFDASFHLCKRVCPLVGLSVCRYRGFFLKENEEFSWKKGFKDASIGWPNLSLPFASYILNSSQRRKDLLAKLKEEREAKTEEGAVKALDRATTVRSNKRLTLATTTRMRTGQGTILEISMAPLWTKLIHQCLAWHPSASTACICLGMLL